MGNSASSAGRGHGDDSVDGGHLFPQGVYTGQRDWNHSIVTQLIIERRLAPFYRPLEDYDTSWDDDQILAARKELPIDPDAPPHELGGGGQAAGGTAGSAAAASSNSSLNSRSGSHLHLHSKKSSQKEAAKPSEAFVYRGAVECPICFLYYPPNINRSRCCDQAVCTECFVQIKRAEPTTTHLVSEPAACPYCVQENFGVVYTPPPWRTGIGADRSHNPHSLAGNNSPRGPQSNVEQSTATPTPPGHKRRQKSFSADSPEVVTTDQIRPDWEAKLAAVRAAVTRRANRRIIMRRVGDQLIPVGVTSGRLPPPSEGGNSGSGSGEGGGGGMSILTGRSTRRGQLEQILAPMGMGGQDLEELMVMEAMRLSLLEHEEQQRKEEAAKKKKEAEEAAASAAGHTSSPGAGPSSQGQQHAETSSLQPPTEAASAKTPDASASNTNLSTQPSLSSPPSETGTSQQYGTLGALVASASSAAAAIGSPGSHPPSSSADEYSPAGEPIHSLEPSSSSSSAPVVSSSPDSIEPPGTGIDPVAATPPLASNDSYISTTTVSTTATGQSSQAYSVLPSDTDTEPADDEPLIAHADSSSSAPVESPHSSQ